MSLEPELLDHPTIETSAKPVLDIRDLTVSFALRKGEFVAVDGVSLSVAPGEVLGVIGESGAGKSMTGAAVIGLIDPPGRIASGEIRLSGARIDTLSTKDLANLRGRRIGTVFQDPLTSLNPLYTIGHQLTETIRAHLSLDAPEARQRAIDLLHEVGIPDPDRRLDAYPHQFSGGQRQRIVIALAIAADPELIIADEPTSALDVSVQAQIIKLLRKLADSRGVAILLITHDMGVIAEIADRVVVMHTGKIVETGTARAIIGTPQRAYTQRLIEAIPSISNTTKRPKALPSAPLVEVEDLSCSFALPSTLVDRLRTGAAPTIKAVDAVSFTIGRGQSFGLVGESGSGKSTTARLLAGLLPSAGGTVRINGNLVTRGQSGRQRGQTQMIFQDPYASLNPRWRVRDIIAEPIRTLGLATNASEIEDRVAELLRRVRLDPASLAKYPHQFSGGQRQRIAIARALSSQPEFIICDEPTSSLDVSVQAQVLDLMAELQAEFGLTYLLISHNLAVVRQMADWVGVMQNGTLVESGPVQSVFEQPQAEYTKDLLAAVPDISHLRGSSVKPSKTRRKR